MTGGASMTSEVMELRREPRYSDAMKPVNSVQHFGDALRIWRQRRRLSQLDLSLEAEISTRHLSFLETGRSQPSREMVLHLADTLDMPLRARNALLVAAGFAPLYPEHSLDDPALARMREAVDLVLKGHEPFPALAIDRHWQLVAANGALSALIKGVDPALMKAPVNVLRLSLHPAGLAGRILNLAEWRDHIIARLERQVEETGDAGLSALLEELRAYPVPAQTDEGKAGRDFAGLVVPLRLMTEEGVLTLFSTTTVFGTPVDVTLSELAIEAFFPADAPTAAILQRLAGRRPEPS